jgi:hypothetical protein
MKTCICGYKKGEPWLEDEKDIGDDEFIPIFGMFFKENSYGDKKEVHIIACPKCKTLKLDD